MAKDKVAKHTLTQRVNSIERWIKVANNHFALIHKNSEIFASKIKELDARLAILEDKNFDETLAKGKAKINT